MRRAIVAIAVLVLLTPLLLASNSPTAQDWLEKGFRHARRWETKEERQAYTRALELDPDFTDAHGALGMSNYTSDGGSIDTVVGEIRAYLTSSPHREHLARAIADWDVYGEERRFHIVMKEVLDLARDKGPAVLEAAAAQDDVAPVHRARLLLLAGERRQQAGELAKARTDFRNAAREQGSGRTAMDAHLHLGALAVADGELRKALHHLRAAVSEGSLACRRIREGKATKLRLLFHTRDPSICDELAKLTDEKHADREIRAEIRSACERAGREGKKVLILWYGPYCPYVMLLEERLAHPRIRKLLAKRFVLVRMNQGALHRGLSVEIEYGDVMRAHGVPSFLVLSPDGTMHSVMKDGPLMDVPHRRFSVARIERWLSGIPVD